MSNYIAVDFETTGLEPSEGAEIIEIGAARFTLDGGITERFSALCRPSKAIPPRATKVHGIRDADVVDCPSSAEVWRQFLAWAGEFDALVAHNAPFEMKFLLALHDGRGDDLPDLQFIDTLELARRRIAEPPSYKLGDLARHLGISQDGLHRAEADAVVVAQLLSAVAATYKNPGSSIKRSVLSLHAFREQRLEEAQLVARANRVLDNMKRSSRQLEEINRTLDAMEEREVKPKDRTHAGVWVFVLALVGLLVFAVLSAGP